MKKQKFHNEIAYLLIIKPPGDIFQFIAIFAVFSPIFRISREIFKSRKYRNISLPIYRLSENIAIFADIAEISAILSSLV